jgi:hypothetical protein
MGIRGEADYRATPSDMQIIHAISSSLMIVEGHGKLCAPSLALDWQIKRLIEVEARVSYHARRWYVILLPLGLRHKAKRV